MRKAGIYRKRGDDGMTSLGDQKVSKGSERIKALGVIDELNAAVGLMVAYCSWSDGLNFYRSLQSDLLMIDMIISGAEVEVDEDRISFLEEEIDRWSAELSPLETFVLPGGCLEAGWLYFTRAVCRRAESAVVGLSGRFDKVIIYLNRLSDLLFVRARRANKTLKEEVLWSKDFPLKEKSRGSQP